jgi:hypothetical protein
MYVSRSSFIMKVLMKALCFESSPAPPIVMESMANGNGEDLRCRWFGASRDGCWERC